MRNHRLCQAIKNCFKKVADLFFVLKCRARGKAFPLVNKLRKYVRIFGAPAPKTGLSASIFFAEDGKKGFPLQSHCARRRSLSDRYGL
jgi:hypothetical protein